MSNSKVITDICPIVYPHSDIRSFNQVSIDYDTPSGNFTVMDALVNYSVGIFGINFHATADQTIYFKSGNTTIKEITFSSGDGWIRSPLQHFLFATARGEAFNISSDAAFKMLVFVAHYNSLAVS